MERPRRTTPPVEAAIEKALERPETAPHRESRWPRRPATPATRDSRVDRPEDEQPAESVRVAAVEAMGSLGLRNSQTVLDRLVAAAKGKPSSSPGGRSGGPARCPRSMMREQAEPS